MIKKAETNKQKNKEHDDWMMELVFLPCCLASQQCKLDNNLMQVENEKRHDDFLLY